MPKLKYTYETTPTFVKIDFIDAHPDEISLLINRMHEIRENISSKILDANKIPHTLCFAENTLYILTENVSDFFQYLVAKDITIKDVFNSFGILTTEEFDPAGQRSIILKPFLPDPAPKNHNADVKNEVKSARPYLEEKLAGLPQPPLDRIENNIIELTLFKTSFGKPTEYKSIARHTLDEALKHHDTERVKGFLNIADLNPEELKGKLDFAIELKCPATIIHLFIEKAATLFADKHTSDDDYKIRNFLILAVRYTCPPNIILRLVAKVSRSYENHLFDAVASAIPVSAYKLEIAKLLSSKHPLYQAVLKADLCEIKTIIDGYINAIDKKYPTSRYRNTFEHQENVRKIVAQFGDPDLAPQVNQIVEEYINKESHSVLFWAIQYKNRFLIVHELEKELKMKNRLGHLGHFVTNALIAAIRSEYDDGVKFITEKIIHHFPAPYGTLMLTQAFSRSHRLDYCQFLREKGAKASLATICFRERRDFLLDKDNEIHPLYNAVNILNIEMTKWLIEELKFSIDDRIPVPFQQKIYLNGQAHFPSSLRDYIEKNKIFETSNPFNDYLRQIMKNQKTHSITRRLK